MRSPLTDNTGLVCRSCGHQLEEVASFCPQCGRQAPAGDPSPPEERDSYLLLVTANILRLRREWELAEAKCSEALRRDPDNPTAYSVMGDIMRDQGRLRDAAEWYKMALDHNPASGPDRRKLEQIIDRIYPDRRGEQAAPGRPAGGRLGRALAALRALATPGGLPLVVGAVLLALLLTSVYAVLVGRGVPANSPPAAARAADASGAFSPAAEQPAEAPTLVVPSAVGDDLVARESELLELVSGAAVGLDPNCIVHSAEIEPEEATASVRLSLPRLLAPAALRGDVLRVVRAAAPSAALWDARLRQVRIRCDARDPDGTQEPVFVAKGDSAAVAKLADTGLRPVRVEEFFHTVWWHPSLRE